MGFVGTDLEGGSKHRSRAFEANELERLVIRPQSLRSLRKLWDTGGVCAGAVPAEWPMCVGYDRDDRQGAFTVRVRSASSGAMLYESVAYWHMQAGQEHDDYEADKAAWQAAVSSGATPFGTTFSMSANSRMTYDLAPIVSLAEKVGFAGNQVIHISTESGLVEANQSAASGGGHTGDDGTPVTDPGAPAPDGQVLMCDKGGKKSKYVNSKDVSKHVAHGCTLGACATASPGGPGTGGNTGTGGGTPVVGVPPVSGPTLPPPPTTPAEPSTSVSDRFKPTSSYPMYAASSNQKVKVCRPDGGDPDESWNEVEMKYKEVEQFLRDHPYAVYGTCSDNEDWVDQWDD